jgi:DNA-binding LacI/PurR family transcriptional regulator
MLEAGLRPAEPIVGNWSSRSGYAAGLAICAMPDVTAVFAANDQMGVGILRALHERGRDVPGDISVVGFDDIPEAAHFAPPLTTVRQNFAEIGRRAVALLLAELSNGEPDHELVVPELIVRQSTSVPPAALRD